MQMQVNYFYGLFGTSIAWNENFELHFALNKLNYTAKLKY